MTSMELTRALQEFSDPALEPYMKKVVSDTRYPMLFVRMEPVRRIAKAAAKADWPALVDGRFESYEQLLCVGLAVAYAKAPMQQKLSALRQLLPLMDSWGLTDSIVTTLRFSEEERQQVWDFALECMESDLEYTVRFGVVLLLRFFLTEAQIPAVSRLLLKVRDERYYVQMAVAWCFAEMAVTDFEVVEHALESGELSLFVHNMTIQKMRESYRISEEKKETAQRLRRKV